MSVLSENVMLISVPPRIVRERTRVKPGTILTASSIGLVTVKSICRAPSEEPWATTRTRGKASSG